MQSLTPGQTNQFVTIVSGLPRSGTSLMMQMLDKGGVPVLTDHVRTADEDNPRGYYEFEPVKRTRKDPSWLVEAPGKVVKLVHLLLLDLPLDREYRVMLMRRDLTEVVKSQNVMLARSGKTGGDLPDDKVIEVFRAQLQKVRRWMEEHANFKLIEVNYNELLKDPGPKVRAIDEFLGGGLDIQAMMRVIDPSLYRNRV